MSNPEQEVRIGLLQHYDSLMEGYKFNLLTIAVAAFAWLELWFGTVRSYSTPSLDVVMSLALGVIIAGILFCFARFFWWGKVVEFAVYMPPPKSPSARPSIAALEASIFRYAKQATKGKGKRKMVWPFGWLAGLGSAVRTLSLACVSVALFAGFLAFCWATAWSIWTLAYLFVVIVGSILSLGSIDP